jgi:plastocyanin domain-containing protein
VDAGFQCNKAAMMRGQYKVLSVVTSGSKHSVVILPSFTTEKYAHKLDLEYKEINRKNICI